MRPFDAGSLGERVVVLSPHLDDAVLSIGGTIARVTRAGARVTVLTVFAGDPESSSHAGEWDRLCGFGTEGEAGRVRRDEDARACSILGATAEWLPFADADYPSSDGDETVWASIARMVSGADIVLTPGSPLEHPDHARLTRIVLEKAPPETRISLYVEQPYANFQAMGRGYSWDVIGRTLLIACRTPAGRRMQRPGENEVLAASLAAPVSWEASPFGRRDRRAKSEAIRAYSSQLEALSGKLVPRIRLFDRGWRGEILGFARR